MKKFLSAISVTLFWLLWPVMFLYLKFSSVRTRVLLVSNDEVLLVRGWISANHYGLPGGGMHKHETAEAGAVREVAEEVGIVLPESTLQKLATHTHDAFNLKYKAHFFVVQLSEKPAVHRQRFEIMEATWVPIAQAASLVLDQDARYALKRYQPPEQASLL